MLTIAGRTFNSRLFVGTGKFSSAQVMKAAIAASGSEMVTVALRRVDLQDPADDIMRALDRDHYLFLPNTSGARDAAEAVRLAQEGGDKAVYMLRATGQGESTGGAETGLTMVKVGALNVPVDSNAGVLIHFTPRETPRAVPAWEVMAKDFDPARLGGGIVFIGTSAEGLKDQRPTPMSSMAPGVEIHAAVAEQMAAGVRERLSADLGLATTGVAGPDPQDGHPPGEVWIAVASVAGIRSVRLELGGDRAAIRHETVEAVIELALKSFPE